MPDFELETISAVTLATADMARAVDFYESLGFGLKSGGRNASFTSLYAGTSYLNLIADDRDVSWWGRIIFWVSDVDAAHAQAVKCGFEPHAPPHDAPWGERYFHITDPDGHELSFARPLDS